MRKTFMERTPMLKTMRAAFVAAFTLAFVVWPTPSPPPAVAVQTKPNIVVITIDDARVDDLAAMPKTKNLIGDGNGNGARYNRSYATLPLCCPSRATLLTGQYAHNHGVLTNSAPSGGIVAFDDSDTLPVWLEQAGYQTVMTGKYLNQYGMPDDPHPGNYVPPGWTNWAANTGNWVNYSDFDVNRNGTIEHHINAYQTWTFNGKANSQLSQRLPSDDPVFMWLSFIAPHDAGSPGCHVPAAPEYDGDSNAALPSSQAFNEPNVADKPSWVNDNPLLTQTDQNDILECRRDRRDSLRSVDDAVADIVATLQSNGELNNTLLIFTSDNGFMQGEHRIKGGKRWPYEESAAVPLLVRGPGMPQGTFSRMVGNVDLAATILDVAGVAPGLPQDGESMLAPLPPAGQKRPILIESLTSPGDMPAYAGVRVDNWAFYDYGVTRELYDLDADPDQLVNRIGDPTYADVRDSLDAFLAGFRDCAGTSCDVTWTEP